jgi:hypothetical protein
MIATVQPAPPVSALGQQLHHLFGQQPWDFLEAATPPPGAKPQWRTVTAYPLKPRILWQRWQDPHRIIGVRFESQTRYGLVDIDVNSPYCHPQAIAEIRAALETIGLVRTLLIRSSHSGGLHLYLPLPEAGQNLRPRCRAAPLPQCPGFRDRQRHLRDLSEPQALRRRENHPLQRPPSPPATGDGLLSTR